MSAQENMMAELLSEIRALRTRMSSLEGRSNRAQSTPMPESVHQTRGVTPAQSAFRGSDYKPVGVAAKQEFKPFGDDQWLVNEDYNPQQREVNDKPSTFTGDKKAFAPCDKTSQ